MPLGSFPAVKRMCWCYFYDTCTEVRVDHLVGNNADFERAVDILDSHDFIL